MLLALDKMAVSCPHNNLKVLNKRLRIFKKNSITLQNI